MTKVIFGNHAAVVVPRHEQDRVRRFYCDVLGFKAIRETDHKDDFQLGDDDYFHLSILYGDLADDSEFCEVEDRSIWSSRPMTSRRCGRGSSTPASSRSRCRTPTCISRLQEDRSSGWLKSTRISRSMSVTLRVTRDGTHNSLPRRAGEPNN
jgi:catechol 2,3-dioxygenase-like lactoylglutathione lyase family enzyme